jgi:uncharacterized protein YutE (UPF0331/DUF86 family)
MADIAGESKNDKKLWFTYLSWPREILKNYRPHVRAEVDEKSRRFDKKYSDSLQSILFSCMVMEYRIKQTFEYKGIKYRKRDTFGTLIDILWTKLENVNTEKSKKKCIKPKRWDAFHKRLRHWVEVRNALVHGNYTKIQGLIPKGKAITEAKKCYNNMVELIKILNGALEYYEGNKRDFIKYMNRLMFR